MIYLDNAATTAMAPEVLSAMMPYFQEFYGNPGGIYGLSNKAKRAVNEARQTIADSLGAERSEIYFTSGGTESDNWALVGIAESYEGKGKHIITSAVEHHGVLHTCQYLEQRGFEVTYVGVDREGVLDMEKLRRSIRPDTILISVMFANNEVGTLQPIKEIGQLARERGILFHTDAVQAYGHLPIDVKEYHIDLLSASGHKLRGPKGIGFLYVSKEVKIHSFMHGGAQERGRRAGTENVPAVVGLGTAVAELLKPAEKYRDDIRAVSDEGGETEHPLTVMQFRQQRERELAEYLIRRIEEEIPLCRLNGSGKQRLANNVNFSFDFVEGESLLILLDQQGICASGGSACTTGATDPSHVLLAMGASLEQARGALRMTLSAENTKEELDEVVDVLKAAVQRLREFSTPYQQYRKQQEQQGKR